MTIIGEQIGTVWRRTYTATSFFLVFIFASVFVASAALATPAAAATPVANTATRAPAQPTVTAHTATSTESRPAASPTNAPPASSPPATQPHTTATSAPSASAASSAAVSPAASRAVASPTATQPPFSSTPPVVSTATATATQPPASPTPTTGATAAPATPTTAVRLVAPTNVPATPPPPPGPTLDLAGLKILDNPGIGGNAAIARAALRHFGEYYRPDGIPWVGWCEMFAGNVLAEAGVAHPRYASAILDALDGPLYRGQAPAGSLVFFDQRSSPYGHVGVSLGDGTMLSALGGGVVRTSYQDWVSYLGWRPYGTPAPDEAPLNLHTYGAAADDPSLSWAAHVPAPADDPSLGWAAGILKAHSFHEAAETANVAAPLSHSDWDEPPPFRSSRQAMK